MSGQLVGEVIAASDSLRASGLFERAFQALIAIAEKSTTQTRQGSVRWDHIRAAQYGKSLATAKRAVRELKDAGLIRVVKRGFNNQAGRTAAPIYEVRRLTTERVTQDDPVAPTERVTQSEPFATERVTQDERFGKSADSQRGANGSSEGGEWVKSGTERVTQDDLLDGSIDELPIDERRGLRFGGTSPGVGSFAPTAGRNNDAYRLADMARECPTCHAPARTDCTRDDGQPRRTPCPKRMQLVS